MLMLKGPKMSRKGFNKTIVQQEGLEKFVFFREKNINMTKVGRQINPLKVINCKNPVTNAPVINTFLGKFTTQSKLCKRFSRGKKALMPYSSKKFELNL